MADDGSWVLNVTHTVISNDTLPPPNFSETSTLINIASLLGKNPYSLIADYNSSPPSSVSLEAEEEQDLTSNNDIDSVLSIGSNMS